MSLWKDCEEAPTSILDRIGMQAAKGTRWKNGSVIYKIGLSGGTREVMGAYKYLEEMWRKKQSEAWSDFSWGNAMSNKGVEVWDGKDELVDPMLTLRFELAILYLDYLAAPIGFHAIPPASHLPWGCDALLSPAPKLGVSSIATWFTKMSGEIAMCWLRVASFMWVEGVGLRLSSIFSIWGFVSQVFLSEGAHIWSMVFSDRMHQCTGLWTRDRDTTKHMMQCK